VRRHPRTPFVPVGADLADVLLRHPHVGILTDEIYDEVWFEAAETANLLQVAPELADRILVVNGVSKTCAMTGWRIGYAAGAPSIIGAINMLRSQSSSCPSTISQFASVAALTGPQEFVSEAVGIYRRRRDLAVERLKDDQAFVLHLLDRAGVVAVHGSAYGVPGHFRVSIATSEKVIDRACTLIAGVCAELH
jgi:aspartate aminotransferase